MTPTLPTQSKHPWRATVRTIAAMLVGAVSLLPTVAAVTHLDSYAAVAQAVAVAALVTRVLAIPGVDGWLRRFAPFLAASPTSPFGR